jgi:rRNA-processing protein FCF1
MGGYGRVTERITQPGILSDANVLIDYAVSAPEVIGLVSRHVQKLYIAVPVVREIDQLSQDDIEKLGVEIIEPTLQQLARAAKIRQGNPSLSGQDAICFVLAKDNNWACLTNDKPLRKICYDNKIICIWGLEVMLKLVLAQKLTPQKAYKIACDIQSKNHYIKVETVERFKKRIGL